MSSRVIRQFLAAGAAVSLAAGVAVASKTSQRIVETVTSAAVAGLESTLSANPLPSTAARMNIATPDSPGVRTEPGDSAAMPPVRPPFRPPIRSPFTP
ncbi:MAG: hypothetical protein RMJ35_03400 [Phycisphaerales bacterium]|nr:hypothetical protein [Phycisphaerales bacterium]